MQSISNFKKLEGFEIELSKLEKDIFRKVPSAKLNLLGLDNYTLKKIIQYQTKLLEKGINYSDSDLVEKIKSHIRISSDVLVEFKDKFSIPELDYQINISRFLASIYLGQKIRIELEKPLLACFQLEKIFSEPERALRGIKELQPKTEMMPIFEVFEYIHTDEFGNLNLQNTIKQEKYEKNISTILTNTLTIPLHTKMIFEKMQSDSKHIPFAVINPDLTNDIALLASQTLNNYYSKYIYNLISNNISLKDSIAQTKKKFQRIALEYINTGKSDSDDIQIGKRIFQSIREELDKSTKFKDEIKVSVGQEILRLVLQIVKDWSGMPKNFYVLNFRNASLIEKEISPEISHSLDVLRISQENNVDKEVFETFVISYPEYIKQQIYLLASRGAKNSKGINDLVEKIEEPNFWDRIAQKINSFVPKNYYAS